MAHDSLSTKSQPHYSTAGVPATAADFTEVSDYAALVGNRKALPHATRLLATGTDVWEGLDWYETDLGFTYRYMGGSWVLVNMPWVDFTPSVAGLSIGGGGTLLFSKLRVTNGECQARIGWRLGTSPTVNDVVVAYPVAVATWMNDLGPTGSATFYDQSASTSGRFHGEVYKTSGGLKVTQVSTGSLMLPVAPTTPFTWTSGDEIHIDARYPVA